MRSVTCTTWVQGFDQVYPLIRLKFEDLKPGAGKCGSPKKKEEQRQNQSGINGKTSWTLNALLYQTWWCFVYHCNLNISLHLFCVWQLIKIYTEWCRYWLSTSGWSVTMSHTPKKTLRRCFESIAQDFWEIWNFVKSSSWNFQTQHSMIVCSMRCSKNTHKTKIKLGLLIHKLLKINMSPQKGTSSKGQFSSF